MIKPTTAMGNEYLHGVVKREGEETPEKMFSFPAAIYAYGMLIEKTESFRAAGHYRQKLMKAWSRFGRGKFVEALEELVGSYFSRETRDASSIGTVQIRDATFSVMLKLTGQEDVAESMTINTLTTPTMISTSIIGFSEVMGNIPRKVDAKLEGVVYQFDLTFDRN